MEENPTYDRLGVVIVAGGSGTRMGGSLPKQFRLLAGEPVLARTIRNFARALPGATIAVVLPQAHTDFWRNFSARFDLPRHIVATGGAERFHSVKNGIAALPPDVELIAVQDGVRPLGSDELIRRTVACAAEHGAAVPVTEPADSFRTITAEGSAAADRTRLRIVQTPQVFRATWLREACDAPFDPSFTDDASAVERQGHRIVLCAGERMNIKLTTPEDFTIAEAILRRDDESRDDDHEDESI